MSLTLHYHPLASFCWKVLIGLYENQTAFTPKIIDLGDPASRDPFVALWPMGKMPVLFDEARGQIVPETSVILDYLDLHHPGPVRFLPADPDVAWRARLWDRIFDSYVQAPMQAVVADRLRPAGDKDPTGVAQARAQLATAYDLIERHMAARTWCSTPEFGLADCAAAPALFYGDKVLPLGVEHPATAAYLERLKARPSFARVLAEAEPYFKFFPTA
jgi:glutathione S-transferase